MKYNNTALTAARLLNSTDVAYCVEAANAAPDGQVQRRCLIRAQFAYVEAFLYALHYQAAAGDAGQLLSRQSTKDSIETALNGIAKALCSTYRVNKKEKGWCALLQAYQIRDRITHPKSPSELEIRPNDLKVVDTGVEWLFDVCTQIEQQRMPPTPR